MPLRPLTTLRRTTHFAFFLTALLAAGLLDGVGGGVCGADGGSITGAGPVGGVSTCSTGLVSGGVTGGVVGGVTGGVTGGVVLVPGHAFAAVWVLVPFGAVAQPERVPP